MIQVTTRAFRSDGTVLVLTGSPFLPDTIPVEAATAAAVLLAARWCDQ